MHKNESLYLMLLCGLILTCCVKQRQEDAAQKIRNITRSRVVKIPVHLLTSDTSRAALRQNPGALTMTPGAQDELPRGPESFDVLDDGGLVITDPLQQRLVFYDSLGNYQAEWPIGFAANSVRLMESGVLEVRKANSNNFYRIDDSGDPRPAPAMERRRGGVDDRGEAHLLGRNRGRILRPQTRGAEGGTLEINFESDSTQMISLQSLGTDHRGFTYVALETTRGASDFIDIIKIIRKYAADGKVVGQITDIPLEYDVHPTDEFRVHDGMVYQLMPQKAEVKINIWNTN